MRGPVRGFSLTELLVAMVASAVIAAGALGLVVAQQRAFTASAGDRGLQETARTALGELGMSLRRAGYGVEPWLALDFGPANGAFANQSYPSGAPSAFPPSASACTGADAVSCRDSVTGPDELVFYARDPAFSRALAAAPTSTRLTLATPLVNPLYQGQVLQVMCGGASRWAYVTVGAKAGPGDTAVALGTASSGPFPYQQDQLASGCFGAGWRDVLVLKVERFHYYVARYSDGSGADRPYLLLDRGLWDGGAPLVEPVAPDVEDLQVSYLFPGSAVQRVGYAPGHRLVNATAAASPDAAVDLSAAPPTYADLSNAPSRATNHPANVRAVRISLVVRTATWDPQLAGAGGATLPAAANRPASGADGGYRRLLVETTEGVRNLDSRGPFYPSYSTNAGADGLNVGGG
ncbi:PilW family protein [Anaeromyxobacter paludicola]|uniref:Type IV pilus assembly protein PilW n=1 Tax=Anaeromyxobacter paludicola TaxID=2918171 RepID=A0ABM7XB68_9BACT|nr:PilW family protein [Anaeromyxobacter paludicola]BDG09094.1 hypothetical protein AMPC_22070 [Anaeromyxobacter paludicola]